MIQIESPQKMQQWSLQQKKEGKTIAFVPTMGALHEGHLSLLRKGRASADQLVLSIFVNPTQFGPKEDLSKYPRTLQADLENAHTEKVDVIFLPTPEVMYPNGYQTLVEVGPLANGLCGASRPGHFRGVATIVLKLFQLVQPHIALFGQKDFQQLRVIQQMVADFHLPIRILGMPIVCESDGLAMSSRNRYLSESERKSARAISQSLKQAQTFIQKGEKNGAHIKEGIQKMLAEATLKIDYIFVGNPETLQETSTLQEPTLLAIAAFAGGTRLIDNNLVKNSV